MKSEFKRFPEGFLWGAATAAYQIEGASTEDGRTASIWDTFSHTPGAIADGASGDVACDHYHLWKTDVELMKDMGLKAYRFSIAWPRVQANGSGLDFYEKLVDALLAAGIEPIVTLYHWDLPQPLEDAGGWHNRDTVAAFETYTRHVVERLGHKVKIWCTLNEPQIFIGLGYEQGVHAPGRRESEKFGLQCYHHALLAHALASKAIKQKNPDAKVGMAYAAAPTWPASDSPEDLAAAQRHWRRENDWLMLPLIEGCYPEDVWHKLGEAAPTVMEGDLEQMKGCTDYMGLNYYTPCRIAADPDGRPWKVLPIADDAPRPSMPGWEIFAPGMENMLVEYYRRYGLPMMVTENGMSIADDRPEADGRVHDPLRIEYLRDHMAACHKAIEAGVEVLGYMVWSLMDNFEWGLGFSQRFGLLHVDYNSQTRRWKDSAFWYRDVIKDNGLEADTSEWLQSAFRKEKAGV